MREIPVLFLVLLMGCLDFIPTKEERALNEKIESIEIGQAESEVLAIFGKPQRSDQAPFDPKTLPMEPGCEPCERDTGCKLALATRRDHYEWRMPRSESHASLYYVDVYYDDQGLVRCTHDWGGTASTFVHYH